MFWYPLFLILQQSNTHYIQQFEQNHCRQRRCLFLKVCFTEHVLAVLPCPLSSVFGLMVSLIMRSSLCRQVQVAIFCLISNINHLDLFRFIFCLFLFGFFFLARPGNISPGAYLLPCDFLALCIKQSDISSLNTSTQLFSSVVYKLRSCFVNVVVTPVNY